MSVCQNDVTSLVGLFLVDPTNFLDQVTAVLHFVTVTVICVVLAWILCDVIIFTTGCFCLYSLSFDFDLGIFTCNARAMK
jgi:hypothetical protein